MIKKLKQTHEPGFMSYIVHEPGWGGSREAAHTFLCVQFLQRGEKKVHILVLYRKLQETKFPIRS